MTDPYYSPPPSTPYAPAGAAPLEQRTNVLAIVALIAAFVLPLAGIICGHIALAQIKRTGEQGHGLALAGTILGYVFVLFGLLIAAILIAIAVANGVATGVATYNG